tara:strand:- start:2568 stop:2963 length:396 start_codon:yes stop_codon:yes gene_type:complete
MQGNTKVVIVSLVGNVLLVVALVLFIAFGRNKPVEKYEAEIATLTTINDVLEKDNVKFSKLNKESAKKYDKLDAAYKRTIIDLALSNDELDRLKKLRPTDGKSDYVDGLSDDAIIGEFTGYLQRRTKKHQR